MTLEPFTAATRWEHLTAEHLLGAEYALRLLTTSPRIRGAALQIVQNVIAEVRDELEKAARLGERT